jgi:hypothetical protein
MKSKTRLTAGPRRVPNASVVWCDASESKADLSILQASWLAAGIACLFIVPG